MQKRCRLLAAAVAAGFMTGSSWAAFGQSAEPAPPTPAPLAQAQPAVATAPDAAAAAQLPTSAEAGVPGAAAVAPHTKTYIVPAGTKVLLQLRSAVNTKSARPGDGVYLASTFPVVVGNHVMIPSGVYVQGVVDRVERAGHVKGRAQLDMHFTSIIFPNGSVVEIPGRVESLPGAKKQTIKGDEGTIEQDTDKTRNMGKVAEIAIPTGATVGSIGGLESRASPGRRSRRHRRRTRSHGSRHALHPRRRREYRIRDAGGDDSATSADPRRGEPQRRRYSQPHRTGSLGQPAQADGKTEPCTRNVPAGRARLRVN